MYKVLLDPPSAGSIQMMIHYCCPLVDKHAPRFLFFVLTPFTVTALLDSQMHLTGNTSLC